MVCDELTYSEIGSVTANIAKREPDQGPEAEVVGNRNLSGLQSGPRLNQAFLEDCSVKVVGPVGKLPAAAE